MYKLLAQSSVYWDQIDYFKIIKVNQNWLDLTLAKKYTTIFEWVDQIDFKQSDPYKIIP